MRRERFNLLVSELSVLAGQEIPRFTLWMRLHEAGLDPEALSNQQVLRFLDLHLEDFLCQLGLTVSRRARRRLRRTLTRDEPIPPMPAPTES